MLLNAQKYDGLRDAHTLTARADRRSGHINTTVSLPAVGWPEACTRRDARVMVHHVFVVIQDTRRRPTSAVKVNLDGIGPTHRACVRALFLLGPDTLPVIRTAVHTPCSSHC